MSPWKQVWRLSPVLLWACGPGADVPGGDSAATEQLVLDGAQRAVGVWPAPDSLQLLADAYVTGPSSPFRTVIHSSADGRVRMHQTHTGFVAGVGRSGGWLVDPGSGEIQDPGSSGPFVRSHELHMLALLPRSRLEGPRFLGTIQLDSQVVLAIAFSSDSIIAYFSQADTLPVGLRVAWVDPAVEVRWSGWMAQDGVALFQRATFRQGAQEWRYRYDRLELGPLPDSVFEPPTGR